MFNFNTKTIQKKCECGLKAAETAVESVKDITVRPKLDAAIEVKSQKRQKDLFGMSIHFDKELSLFKILLVAVGILASFAVFCSALDALFGSKKCKDETDACND